MAPPSTAAIAALDPRGNLPPARYALELRPGQAPDRVEAAVRAALAEFIPEVRPISPTDHGVLILEIGTRTLHGVLPVQAFAGGYALADDFDLRTAEPDLPTPFFPEEDPPPSGRPVAEAFRFPPGCWVDEEAGLSPTWALERLRVRQAWDYSTAQGRPTRGRGVVIAQPDTGVTTHRELAGVMTVGGYDILGRDGDPTDPLGGLNPGHGTGTASVVVSPEGLTVVGSAPAASHMPIRAITGVVVVSQVAVAEAIGYAVDHGAQVITMSMGGLPAEVLERAVRRAVAADVIVLAAAGNCVRKVVWPARYDECIAVAGTDAGDEMWKGSCRGVAVDISAPGQNVFKAAVGGNDAVKQGQGTSFAVALTAGVAALWLAHHGRADLIAAARERGETLQDMFRRLVRVTARRPLGWNTFKMGAGIVDANALLAADLDAGRDRETVLGPDPVTEPGFTVASMIAEIVGPHAAVDPDLDWHRFGPELAHAMLEVELTVRTDDADTPLPEGAAPKMTEDLAAALTNPRLRDWLRLDEDLGPEAGGFEISHDE